MDKTRPAVGVAKAELDLVARFMSSPRSLYAPGRGYQQLVLDEVELGFGRPDLVLLTVSPGRLTAWRNRGKRLGTWTQARVLGALLKPGEHVPPAVSRDHWLATKRVLESAGWLQLDFAETPIRESLLVEAKTRDWRSGLNQLLLRKPLFRETALLVPSPVARRVPRSFLKTYGLGLITQDGRGALSWRRHSRIAKPPLAADLWLTELAIRHIERQRPHNTPSDSAAADREVRTADI